MAQNPVYVFGSGAPPAPSEAGAVAASVPWGFSHTKQKQLKRDLKKAAKGKEAFKKDSQNGRVSRDEAPWLSTPITEPIKPPMPPQPIKPPITLPVSFSKLRVGDEASVLWRAPGAQRIEFSNTSVAGISDVTTPPSLSVCVGVLSLTIELAPGALCARPTLAAPRSASAAAAATPQTALKESPTESSREDESRFSSLGASRTVLRASPVFHGGKAKNKNWLIIPNPLCSQVHRVVSLVQATFRASLARRAVLDKLGISTMLPGDELLVLSVNNTGHTAFAVTTGRLNSRKMNVEAAPKGEFLGNGSSVVHRVLSYEFFPRARGETQRLAPPNSAPVSPLKSASSDPPLVFQPFSPGTFGDQSKDGKPNVWLLVRKTHLAQAHGAATRIQALVRRMTVEFSVMPVKRQEARRNWLQKRAADLAARKAANQKVFEVDVSRQLSALPRSTPGIGRSTGGGAPPDKRHLLELKTRMAQLVGLRPVKDWISKLVDDSLRYLMAGERLPLRHMLLSGRLGTGRRTSAELVAKALCAVGVLQNDLLCTSWSKARPGCVTFIDHVKENDEEGISKALAVLEESCDMQGAPGMVILGSRDGRSLSTLAGRLIALQKREPHKINLPSFTTTELATLTLQKIAGRISLAAGVTVPLVQQAIESRWSPGEREMRNVYIANDMAEYLVHSAIVKETQVGRGNEQLKAAAERASASCDALPLEVVALMEGFGRDSVGASSIGVEHLGLPALALAKESKAQEQRHHDQKESKSTDASRQAQREAMAKAAAHAAEVQAKMEEARRSIDAEVEALVGMLGVKKWFEEIRGKVRFSETTGNTEILTSSCLNMVLTGNPGTGKTTIARLMFRFLRAYGVLKQDRFVECNALELKGEFVGHTAPKVIGTIRSALGGALFLDEAYALGSDDGQKSDVFSNEAIRTLLTEVENNRTSVMVILAGYREKMGALMRSDPGLPRRFPLNFHLADFSPTELTRIAEGRARLSFGMSFDEGVAGKLAEAFETVYAFEVAQHNGGLSVRLVDEAMGRFASRMDRMQRSTALEEGAKSTTPTALTIRDFDLEDHFDALAREAKEKTAAAEGQLSAAQEAEARERRAEKEAKEALKQEALAELEGMIGFGVAKEFVRKLVLKVEFVNKGGSRKVLDTCRHLVLTGGPGVGKTTLARLLHKVLFASGVLKEDVFYEKNALQLKGQFVGQTSPKVSDAFAAAKGGTLFLDEAYALCASRGAHDRDSFASDAIATLLTESERHRTDVMLVMAGYAAPMQTLLGADPGLRRRFQSQLHLPDYSPEELAQIAEKVARERFDLSMGPGAGEALVKAFKSPKYAHEVNLYNASLPIRLVEEALSGMAERIMETGEEGASGFSELLLSDFRL